MMLGAMVVTACLLALAGAAHGLPGSPLPVKFYAMPNGDGVASGGAFNFWDATHECFIGPCVPGAATTDNAPLGIGPGALTDGVVAAAPWPQVSNFAGTGQYVGWNWREYQQLYAGALPTITFFVPQYADFGHSVVYSVAIAVDDSRIGGVAAPIGLLIDGQFETPIATPISPTAEWLTVNGEWLGGRLTVTPLPDPGSSWELLSEAQVTAAFVSEPAAWAMMLAGVAAIGMVMRRARREPTAPRPPPRPRIAPAPATP